jgi:hypothetical protein
MSVLGSCSWWTITSNWDGKAMGELLQSVAKGDNLQKSLPLLIITAQLLVNKCAW